MTPSPSVEASPTATVHSQALLSPIPPADVEAIKQALATHDKVDVNKILIDVNPNHQTAGVVDSMYATGGYGLVDSSGGWWIAAKVNGKWNIVTTGNCFPSCSELQPYRVPSVILNQCMDPSGNLINRWQLSASCSVEHEFCRIVKKNWC